MEPGGSLSHTSGRQDTSGSPLAMVISRTFFSQHAKEHQDEMGVECGAIAKSAPESLDKGLTEAPPLIVHVWHQGLLHVAKGAHALGGKPMATGKRYQWQGRARD